MRKKEERRGQTPATAEMKGQEMSWWLEQAQRKSRQETKQCHAEAKRLQSQWEDGGLSVSAGDWHRSQ